MKTKIFSIIILILLFGCSKEDSIIIPSITGNTYAAFSSHKSVDGAALYNAYQFINDSTALELMVDGDGVVYSSFEVEYNYFYPNIAIRNTDQTKGVWLGSFDGEGNLIIKGFKMRLKK